MEINAILLALADGPYRPAGARHTKKAGLFSRQHVTKSLCNFVGKTGYD